MPGTRQEDVSCSTPLQSTLPNQHLTLPETPTFVQQDSEPLLPYILLWKNPALTAVSFLGALLLLVACATAGKWWPHGSFVTGKWHDCAPQHSSKQDTADLALPILQSCARSC
jgi:hypothetical protein